MMKKMQSVTVRNLMKKIHAEAVLAFLALLALVLYGRLAYSGYIWNKTVVVKDIFNTISNMELSDIGEEDEEVLKGYGGDRIRINIIDSDFEIVYSVYSSETTEEPGKYVQDHLDEYQDSPTIHVNRRDTLSIIRLRGMVHQEQDYYIYIRLEIRSIGEIVRHTVVYFLGVWLLLAAVWYLWLRGWLRQEWMGDMASQRVPARRPAETGEKTSGQSDTALLQAEFTQAQREFVADVTHELKTPLAVISGQMEMLETMGDQIDREYYFDSIREEISRMSDMISHMLNLTIMEHQMETMEMEEVDLAELLQYLLLKYDALFHQRGIHLKTDIAKRCIVHGNQMYLEQAVSNYIMNAFERTAQGREIAVGLYMEDGFAVVSVYNEGTSLDREQMERIWQRFYSRPSGSRSANAGLGLSMVRKIADLHHGSCGAENVEKGVKFWLKLPV